MLAGCAGAPPSGGPATNARGQSFQRFYQELREEARRKGHNPAQLDDAFGGVIAPVGEVLRAEQSQPELVRTFDDYVAGMLSATRIARGRERAAAHRGDLAATYARTGVSPTVVVALWGVETNFGRAQGRHPVLPALVTLAWRSPRGEYFRREVFEALRVVERAEIAPAALTGSWAGAMGQCQFMPSSYMAYAQDGDGDGRADIWNSEADVFASAANYLKAKGWRRGQGWRFSAAGVDAAGLKLNSRGLSEPAPLAQWRQRGLRWQGQGAAGFTAETPLRYYAPQPGGPAYLLGPNFDVILRWNNSSYFAYSVLALADVLAEGGQ